jgi:cation diffusion facilitator CzcD-associated flavoprotein CzcO
MRDMEKNRDTAVLIIGASFSGLACAACLQEKKISYIIIDKAPDVAHPWRQHYERLHLHTSKRVSHLPFRRFKRGIPNYPSRQQVVDYLEEYRSAFGIAPEFNTTAQKIYREGDSWITETNSGLIRSRYVIMCTGPFGRPKPIDLPGMETFPGRIIHSAAYKTGRDFKGQQVLVVGFGNSACEITIDLFEQGATVAMSVRSPVNVIPRDILGMSVLEVSILASALPPRIADSINAPLIRLLVGDIRKLGLKKLPYGPLQQVHKDASATVLDIGTIHHIRKGNIRVYPAIQEITGGKVCFIDGSTGHFDAIVAGIGYYRDYADIVKTEPARFEDLKRPLSKQEYFGKDGLYFCGYWISPTGQIREIAKDAQKIAKSIEQRQENERGNS